MSAANLTSAERERLAILIEEMGESIHCASKILRHGWTQRQYDNRARLEHELGQVAAGIAMMIEAKDLDEKEVVRHAGERPVLIAPYLYYQD